MNITGVYACPTCKEAGEIVNVVALLSDTRFDIVKCNHCGCSWRVYYKVGECRVEVLNNGAPPEVAPTNERAYNFDGDEFEIGTEKVEEVADAD